MTLILTPNFSLFGVQLSRFAMIGLKTDSLSGQWL